MSQYDYQSSPLLSDDDDDRQNRFLNKGNNDSGVASLRERAASQPPRSSELHYNTASPSQQHVIPASLGRNPTWINQQRSPNPGYRSGPIIPTRSSSFSSNAQGNFGSAMRESRAFESTFEDDESDAWSERYDDGRYQNQHQQSQQIRGRTLADPSRSRSQSLATPITSRPASYSGHNFIGSPPSGGLSSWKDSMYNSNPLNIPVSRYGEIKPPGSSRYGSLGPIGRLSNPLHSPSSSLGNGGYSYRQNQIDPSNSSPFVRDVGQILLDDGSAFRELWAGMNPPRDENGGGGSGTTSRRHSVSVVQPRRGSSNIIGFNAPEDDNFDEPVRPTIFGQTSLGGGRSGLMLSDDDLASDLGLLSMSPRDGAGISQPSSLPVQTSNLHLGAPGTPTSYSRRSPSDNGLSGNGNSPPRQYDQQLQQDSQFPPQNGQRGVAARFIPGHGLHFPQQQPQQYQNGAVGTYARARVPSYTGGNLSSPISPGGSRQMPLSQSFYPQQGQQPGSNRRISDAAHTQSALADLGKGVPLHSVPASWPLFIVEFKAGRTDLFYLTDLSQDIRVGDLVIVEADRGKDLGKVVNDTITLAEVEAFQMQQVARASSDFGGNSEPMSPGGTGAPVKKEINPKRIYGKATAQDTQLLHMKIADELKALQLCQSKVEAKKLPMQVVDAEYQWDRRKLTFYFVADKRIDFRELVRELFRLYKTRIWMASLQGPGAGYES